MKAILSILSGVLIALFIVIGSEIENQIMIALISIGSIIIGALIIDNIYKKARYHIRSNFNDYGKKEVIIKKKINDILFKIEQIEITKRNTNLVNEIEFKNDMLKKQNEFINYLVDYLKAYVRQWFMVRAQEIIKIENIDSISNEYDENSIRNVKEKIKILIDEIDAEVSNYDTTGFIEDEINKINKHLNEALKKIVIKRTATIIASDSPVERESDNRLSQLDFISDLEITSLDELNRDFDIFIAQKEIAKT